jgi:hypothetical protein
MGEDPSAADARSNPASAAEGVPHAFVENTDPHRCLCRRARPGTRPGRTRRREAADQVHRRRPGSRKGRDAEGPPTSSRLEGRRDEARPGPRRGVSDEGFRPRDHRRGEVQVDGTGVRITSESEVLQSPAMVAAESRSLRSPSPKLTQRAVRWRARARNRNRSRPGHARPEVLAHDRLDEVEREKAEQHPGPRRRGDHDDIDPERHHRARQAMLEVGIRTRSGDRKTACALRGSRMSDGGAARPKISGGCTVRSRVLGRDVA